eukprot:TRINITY_DN4712_c0_g1_i3.p1 TRINITY_DN4712_c0_g1~~TRINITY_DN4712_c0_g1_i3.p1  ORF type:complete len:310 (-),score=52.10 TRINITY_DN4712_c0_g1_i3:562-1491(-)
MFDTLGCFYVRLGRYRVYAKVVGYHFKPNGHIRSFGFITLKTEFRGQLFHNPSACTISMWDSIGMTSTKGHFYTDCFAVTDPSEAAEAAETDLHTTRSLKPHSGPEIPGIRMSDLISLEVRKGAEQWISRDVIRIDGRKPVIEIGCYIKNDRIKGNAKYRGKPLETQEADFVALQHREHKRQRKSHAGQETPQKGYPGEHVFVWATETPIPDETTKISANDHFARTQDVPFGYSPFPPTSPGPQDRASTSSMQTATLQAGQHFIRHHYVPPCFHNPYVSPYTISPLKTDEQRGTNSDEDTISEASQPLE